RGSANAEHTRTRPQENESRARPQRISRLPVREKAFSRNYGVGAIKARELSGGRLPGRDRYASTTDSPSSSARAQTASRHSTAVEASRRRCRSSKLMVLIIAATSPRFMRASVRWKSSKLATWWNVGPPEPGGTLPPRAVRGRRGVVVGKPAGRAQGVRGRCY